MFDLFVLREIAQRRVKDQFEPQKKAPSTVTETVEDGRRPVRRTA